MWVRDNKVWYEAELIEKIISICKNTCTQNDCDYDNCCGCKHIDEEAAIKRILDLIKSYEGKDETY